MQITLTSNEHSLIELFSRVTARLILLRPKECEACYSLIRVFLIISNMQFAVAVQDIGRSVSFRPD